MKYMNPYRQVLEHHGVLGMKWGVRRSRRQLARGNAKYLTDEQLQNTIRRIELEKRYTQLTSPEKSGAAKFIKDTLATSSKEVAKNYTSKAMTSTIESILKKAAKKAAN